MDILDPNIYFNQIDNSALPKIATENGATIIGAFTSGPAFVPTVVDQYNYNLFGTTNGIFYAPYALQQYSKNSTKNPVVIRALWNQPYVKKATIFTITGGSASVILLSKTNTTSSTLSFNGTNIMYSSSTGVVTASVDPTQPNNVLNIFTQNPQASKDFYLYYWSKSTSTLSGSSSVDLTYTSSATTGNVYSNASSPSILDNTSASLFSFQTLGDGNSANNNIKIVIANIKPGTSTVYSKFDVIIRSFDDTDQNQVQLQQFSNCDLDPTSTSYICRLIGDAKVIYDSTKKRLVQTGDYSNKSSYVRVVPSTNLSNGDIAPNVFPWGYTLNNIPFTSNIFNVSDMFITSSIVNTLDNSKVCYGLDYSNFKNNFLFNSIPSASITNANFTFNLSNCLCTQNTSSVTSGSETKYLKFTLPVFGGCDGINPSSTYTGLNGFDISSITSSGTKQLSTALDLVSAIEYIDTDIINIPGLSLYRSGSTAGSQFLVDKLNTICSQRKDCMSIIDADDNSIDSSLSLSSLVTQLQNFDTSYVACYYPYVKLYDKNISKYVWVPASTVVLGAFAHTDKVSYSWFSPAGFNRAGLQDVKDIKYKLNQKQRSDLYNNRVNPLAYFPNRGPVVWGQKTLLKADSALSRINVRRLSIKIKRFVDQVGLNLLWDPNTQVLWNRFLTQVRPYLSSLVQMQGIRAYEVTMDATTNTPDVIDRNMLKGKIVIQPTRAAQYILIDFNINPTTD